MVGREDLAHREVDVARREGEVHRGAAVGLEGTEEALGVLREAAVALVVGAEGEECQVGAGEAEGRSGRRLSLLPVLVSKTMF